MPDADTFTKRDGQPPVFKAYRSDPDTKARELVGYVFLTSDIPPEEVGYSAPIEVLVGMDLTGTLTGVKVGRYRESIIRIWGDFLRLPGVQEQFAGKRVTDPFRVGRDVAGITRATITMRAMSRGIREAARRVTEEYLNPYAASTPVPPATITDSVDRVSAPTDDNAPGQSQAVGLAQLHVDELAFSSGETESALSQALSDGTRFRVLTLVSLLILVMFAFFRKSETARWTALGVTLVYLGFVDGGFLSISHVTNGIAIGPSLFLGDLSLLFLTAVAIAATVVWGRIFCGFLCPFGAFQLFLTRLVPSRLHRRVPQAIHDRALYIKYALLSLILALALVRSDLSVFQYFEPFGTLFFLGSSAMLWAILVAIVAASAVVPQFYCRYVCPLGAAFGLASFLALSRIKRVEQCDVCKLCELRCSTAAIRGPKIDFKECIRCGVCDVKLITRAGACRHSIEEIRKRLENWQNAQH
jgi:hypothetical protein